LIAAISSCGSGEPASANTSSAGPGAGPGSGSGSGQGSGQGGSSSQNGVGGGVIIGSGGGSGTMASGTTASGTTAGTRGSGGGGVTSNHPCMGCKTFPDNGAPACDAKVLGPPSIAYPVNGILLPPNMNVLEVQFVPPAGATLFEVDFTNGLTHV